MAIELDPAGAETDRRLMAAALRLGRQSRGAAGSAPPLAMLVVRFEDGLPVVVGRSGPTGEGQSVGAVLAVAGEAARGATAYMLVEPTVRRVDGGSDTRSLIEAGIARVVFAMDDPDPERTGSGAAALAEAGIGVTAGVLGDVARRLYRSYVTLAASGRPHVVLKLAVSADGMIGAKSGERMLVSGPEAFEWLQAMRMEADASLVGIETALVNDPSLFVQVEALRSLSPIRVVLDSHLRLPIGSAFVETAHEIPLLVITGPDAPVERRAALEAAGAEVIGVPAGTGGLDWKAVLAELHARGVGRLLVEGGARVAASLVGQGLADEVVLFHAPVVVGPDGVRALAGGALSSIERSPRYRLVEQAMLGEDQMVRYERSP